LAFAPCRSFSGRQSIPARRTPLRSERFCARCVALAACALCVDNLEQIFHSMAIAVSKLHEAGIVHNDISAKMFKVGSNSSCTCNCPCGITNFCFRCFRCGKPLCRTTNFESSSLVSTKRPCLVSSVILHLMFTIWAEPCFGLLPIAQSLQILPTVALLIPRRPCLSLPSPPLEERLHKRPM
jgi:hypothetical protein